MLPYLVQHDGQLSQPSAHVVYAGVSHPQLLSQLQAPSQPQLSSQEQLNAQIASQPQLLSHPQAELHPPDGSELGKAWDVTGA